MPNSADEQHHECLQQRARQPLDLKQPLACGVRHLLTYLRRGTAPSGPLRTKMPTLHRMDTETACEHTKWAHHHRESATFHTKTNFSRLPLRRHPH
eukprot:4648880-Amphidinium_carterae.1